MPCPDLYYYNGLRWMFLWPGFTIIVVAVSVLVAILASYTALDLGARVTVFRVTVRKAECLGDLTDRGSSVRRNGLAHSERDGKKRNAEEEANADVLHYSFIGREVMSVRTTGDGVLS